MLDTKLLPLLLPFGFSPLSPLNKKMKQEFPKWIHFGRGNINEKQNFASRLITAIFFFPHLCSQWINSYFRLSATYRHCTFSILQTLRTRSLAQFSAESWDNVTRAEIVFADGWYRKDHYQGVLAANHVHHALH